MSGLKNQSQVTPALLQRAVVGDAAALDELLRHCGARLTALTRRMLGDYERVRRWAQTDDVLQNALVRLLNAMQSVRPQTPRDFLALASLQIRRELIDLARHFYGPEGMGANHDSQTRAAERRHDPCDPADDRDEPATLARWTELHERIGALPDDEREVVDLLYYQEMTQAQAAATLNVSLRTVQRRWHQALGKLHVVWQGDV